MPYYVYKITTGPRQMIKTLELQKEFDTYKDAKALARTLRSDLGSETDVTIKVMFAANQLEAEEQLLEHREAPILREWEK
jgi:hypothetical protein